MKVEGEPGIADDEVRARWYLRRPQETGNASADGRDRHICAET